MMRGVGIKKFGKADQVQILEVPKPEIEGEDDILIKVKAAGFNPEDPLAIAGYTRIVKEMKYTPLSL
jgi:NADPH:quinone reductase-like Zn-dependent oxidoreductase